jgi:hypothetical protein
MNPVPPLSISTYCTPSAARISMGDVGSVTFIKPPMMAPTPDDFEAATDGYKPTTRQMTLTNTSDLKVSAL